jgi:VIT1/CCC1 family predicted Fe2+/Mn2+ transporter
MNDFMPDSSPANDLRGQVGRVLPDIVYGANDGIITTFAVVSGVVGGSLPSQVVLILGFANLLADGVSMGASNFLAQRSHDGAADAVTPRNAARHGIVTFISFVLVGAIPLFAFILSPPSSRFLVATIVTLSTLFTVGAMRSTITRVNWLRSGLEMLVVGAAAAAIAYGIGAFIARLAGSTVV